MKKTLLAMLAAGLLLCSCGTSSSPDTGVTSPSHAAPEYLQTVFAPAGQGGSLSLETDLDGDGAAEKVTITADEASPDYCADLQIACGSGQILSARVEGCWPVALAAADLQAGDGCVELLAACDYASDDYVTSVYRLSGGELQYMGKNNGMPVSASEGVVTLKWYDSPFGTWWMYGDYVLSGTGRSLVLSGDFSIRPEDYPEGEDYALRLTAPLEVYTGSGTAVLPEGTQVMPVGCDFASYVELLCADGVRCRINVRYAEDEWGMMAPVVVLPDGSERDADELFGGLPYWG